MIQGIHKDDYPSGTEIILTNAQETKPKGRIIIA